MTASTTLKKKYKKVEDQVVQQTAVSTALIITFKAKLTLQVDKTNEKVAEMTRTSVTRDEMSDLKKRLDEAMSQRVLHEA